MATMDQITGLTEALQKISTDIATLTTNSNNALTRIETKADNNAVNVETIRVNVETIRGNLEDCVKRLEVDFDMNNQSSRLKLLWDGISMVDQEFGKEVGKEGRVTKLEEEFGKDGRLKKLEDKFGDKYDIMLLYVETLQIEVNKELAQVKQELGKHVDAFRLQESTLGTMQLDLTAKTSRLEGAISGAYAAVQQASTGVPGASQGGSGGGFRRMPLDSDKKFEGIPKLTGNEPTSDILEWKRRIEILIESSVPGSMEALSDVSKRTEPMFSDDIASSAYSLVLNVLNRELYPFLMNKATGRADGVLRTVEPRRGVEAWRVLWEDLGRKDPQSIHVEFIKLTRPKQVAKTSQMAAWLSRWETRLTELQEHDPT